MISDAGVGVGRWREDGVAPVVVQHVNARGPAIGMVGYGLADAVILGPLVQSFGGDAPLSVWSLEPVVQPAVASSGQHLTGYVIDKASSDQGQPSGHAAVSRVDIEDDLSERYAVTDQGGGPAIPPTSDDLSIEGRLMLACEWFLVAWVDGKTSSPAWA